MLKVGLTGSIAVGKSFVCQVFKDLGAFVLDADQKAREVVQPYTEGWKKVVEAFGTEILNKDDTINRTRLGDIVFSNEKKRALLNSIIHPLVIEEQDKWLKECELKHPKAIAIVDAALMIESGAYKRFDKLVVVWCKPEIQIQRLMNRNNLSEQEAIKRINAQMSQEEKKKYADFLIDTSNSFEDTRRQVTQIFEKLKECSKKAEKV